MSKVVTLGSFSNMAAVPLPCVGVVTVRPAGPAGGQRGGGRTGVAGKAETRVRPVTPSLHVGCWSLPEGQARRCYAEGVVG